MKAITLQEPWAWAVACAGKRIENRDWRPSLAPGEYLAIHAGKVFDMDAAIHLRVILEEDGPEVPTEEGLVLGAVAAVARFRRVYEQVPKSLGQSRWRSETRLAWYFDEVWKLPTRVPCVGRQGLWTLPEDVFEVVGEQWGKSEVVSS